jgi:RNA methyltransferase, TrmH family
VPLPELDVDGDVVLVLGAEREGLPAEVLATCDVQASIPQPGEAESLNVALAGAIALYELSRRAAAA